MARNQIKLGIVVIFMLTAVLIAGCGNSGTPSASPAVQAALAITTPSLADGNVGISYSKTVQATGGSGSYAWSVSQGLLPTGFSLSTKTGSLSGMPLTPGTSNFTIQAVDNSGKTASKAFSITIVGAPAPLGIRTSDLLNGEMAINYIQPLQAIGGTAPYLWLISGGSLPDGLSVDANSGVLSGKPLKTGKFFFSPQVTDSKGTIATTALSITVAPTLSITTAGLDQAEVGVAYTGSINVADGVEKYTWSISAGVLPGGLTLDPTSGGISGQPAASGTFNFTAQVSDIWGATVTSQFSIKVNEAIALTTKSLPNGQVGAPYSQTLQFTGGNGTVIWANAGGALPDGLNFDGNTGAITGTPKKAGVFKFSAEVIDNFGASDLKDITITIDP